MSLEQWPLLSAHGQGQRSQHSSDKIASAATLAPQEGLGNLSLSWKPGSTFFGSLWFPIFETTPRRTNAPWVKASTLCQKPGALASGVYFGGHPSFLLSVPKEMRNLHRRSQFENPFRPQHTDATGASWLELLNKPQHNRSNLESKRTARPSPSLQSKSRGMAPLATPWRAAAPS